MVEREEIRICVTVLAFLGLSLGVPCHTGVLWGFYFYVTVIVTNDQGKWKLLFNPTAKYKSCQFTLCQLQLERHVWSDETPHSEKSADIFEHLPMQIILLAFME